MIPSNLTKTLPSKPIAIIRIIAALPLLAIGMQHLTGAAPMLPVLKGAGIPFPELNAIFAPIFEVLAGVLLISGGFARIGALIAIGAMAAVIYSHLVFDWVDEPPVLLPIAILVMAGIVLIKGAGDWSVDRRIQRGAP